MGDVRTVMISGDHALSAIAVARDVELIPKDFQLIFGGRVVNGEIEWVDENDATTALPDLSTLENNKIDLAVSGEVTCVCSQP